MNDRQTRFLHEYLADPDLNATRAYLRAYPRTKPGTARRSASALLATPEVAAAVAVEMGARQARTAVTADRVILELARIAFADPRKLYHADGRLKAPHELDADAAATVASAETEETGRGKGARVRACRVKQWDKKEALALLGKHLGLFTDRVQVSADVTTTATADGLDFSALSDDQVESLVTLLDAARPGAAAPRPAPSAPA